VINEEATKTKQQLQSDARERGDPPKDESRTMKAEKFLVSAFVIHLIGNSPAAPQL
jgi:hypothetical protein